MCSRYCASILILIILCISGGNCERCPLNNICSCRRFQGKLFADCSDRDLISAPKFSDDIIGINFAKNSFFNIPKTLPKNLLYLDMSNNALVSISTHSFTKYRLLQNLSLSYNVLTEVPIGTFRSNKHLRKLDVSYNMELTIEVIYNISLDLENSSIQVLNFEKLHCTYGVNQILKHYHVTNLRHTQLQELNIASNRLNSIELGAISLLPKSLRKLNIADNVLSFGFYTLEMSSLNNLEILNSSFQSAFHQISFIGYFSEKCNDTKRIALPCHFTRENKAYNITDDKKRNDVLVANSNNNNHNNYYYTRFLKHSMNYTIYIPKNLRIFYQHDSLYKFSFQKFPIAPDNSLTHIFLQRNIIYELIGPVTGIFHVRYIDLSGNVCKFINENFFRHFPNLEYLNLSNNALSETFESDEQGGLFTNQHFLSILDLSYNRIAHLPKKVFQYNDNLQHLDLSFNSLSQFMVDIRHMRNLSTLDLSNNQLVQLDLETRLSLDRLPVNSINVNLERNNLKCSCENMDFLKWIFETKKVKFVGLTNYSCLFNENPMVSLENLKGILKKLEKRCASYSLLIVLTTTFIIVFLTTTVSRIIYRFRWKLRYMYYVAKEKYKGELTAVDSRGQSSFRFDAFISYAEEDRKCIFRLVDFMEKDYGLQLCMHHRDFIPGTGIADNITNAIHCSKRTVCFITKHFLDSYWCMFELNMARMEAIYSRNGENVLFLVALEKGIMKQLPLQLMELVSSRSYLDFPDDDDDIGKNNAIVAFRAKLGETLVSD